jgi:hypothetical protein
MKDIKEVIGYPMYTITNEGDVYSLYRNRFLTKNNNGGYYQVWLKGPDGKSKWHYIHRLVAQHFLVKPESDKVLWVNHEDGDKSNNHVSNLSWMTISQNVQHAVDTGLRAIRRGVDHWNHGKTAPWATGPKMRWAYVLPTGEKLNYKELKAMFPDNYVSISDKCKKKTRGYDKVAI